MKKNIKYFFGTTTFMNILNFLFAQSFAKKLSLQHEGILIIFIEKDSRESAFYFPWKMYVHTFQCFNMYTH